MSCSYYTFRQGDYYCSKKSDYVNSDVYYKYCRNYDYSDCPIYKAESSSCYLTSACVFAKGLPDDCYELETLRDYRDRWLAKTEQGAQVIQQYYEIAPRIVSAINDSNQRSAVYERIYEQMVLPCVKLIEQGKMQETLELYQSWTLQLQAEFC
jgi:hypothetical protein